MHPRADSPGLGVGLPVIYAIADSVQVSSNSHGNGTDLRMHFRQDCEGFGTLMRTMNSASIWSRRRRESPWWSSKVSTTSPTADVLRDTISDAIKSGPGVVVDLDRAEFIDSAVLRVLIVGQQQAHDAGTGFAIAITDSTGHAVRTLLELTGLDRKLTVAPGRAEALAAVAEADGFVS